MSDKIKCPIRSVYCLIALACLALSDESIAGVYLTADAVELPSSQVVLRHVTFLPLVAGVCFDNLIVNHERYGQA